MKTVGVIGAGVMGVDVAVTLAHYGYEVILYDNNQEALGNIKNVISRNIRNYKMTSMLMKDWTAEESISRITATSDINDVSNASWIVENVTENWDSKCAVYESLRNICGEDTYFAVNTSCTSITKIASLLKKPSKVIGMHFMNPVPLKEFVEVIKGFHTSEETIAQSQDFLKSMGKNAVLINDSPGFVSNRISHLYMNEAAMLVQENVASAKDIDAVFKKGYAHKMGPLETADLIGLDTVVHSLDVLYEELGAEKFKCCPLLRRMVSAGLLGVKSGKGFYNY